MKNGGLLAREYHVHPRHRREFGLDVPETARLLFGHLTERAEKMASLSFAVAALPPTVNHMYLDNRGGKKRLSPEALAFREKVDRAIGSRWNWQPKGHVIALVFLHSPYWVSKRCTMQNNDADNRLKALFDAIQLATEVPDFTTWEIHCYKIPTATVLQTSVYMFDGGPEVDFWP